MVFFFALHAGRGWCEDCYLGDHLSPLTLRQHFPEVLCVMGPVLVVEDHADSRDFLKQLLEQDGREVITANDGVEALECVRSSPPPRLILLDLSMPGMNGWEFLLHKNTDPTIAGIPTIVVSSTPIDLPAGAMDHLTKPVDIGWLQALVDQYC
jgi:CheY-like chemotaxis protein